MATVEDSDTPKAREATAADIAQERVSLLKRAEELKAKLEAGKESELDGLHKCIEEFNRIFDTRYQLTILPSETPKLPSLRKCTLCQQSGHNKKNCPQKTA